MHECSKFNNENSQPGARIHPATLMVEANIPKDRKGKGKEKKWVQEEAAWTGQIFCGYCRGKNDKRSFRDRATRLLNLDVCTASKGDPMDKMLSGPLEYPNC